MPALRSHGACVFAHLANKDQTEGQGPTGASSPAAWVVPTVGLSLLPFL